MKYSEVIKALEENTSKKFEAIAYGDRYEMSVLPNGYFVFRVFNGDGEEVEPSKPRGGFSENVKSTLDWHEIDQSVTWQEAFEAWAKNNKTIHCKINGDTWTYHRENGNTELVASEEAVSSDEILYGTWFIKGE